METWFPHKQNNICIIESVQRTEVRFVYHKYSRFDLPTELLKTAGSLTIVDRVKLGRLKFMFFLSNFAFKIDKNAKRLETRSARHVNSETIFEYSFDDESFKYSFFPSATRDWNSLNKHFFRCTTVELFSDAVEKQILCEFMK